MLVFLFINLKIDQNIYRLEVIYINIFENIIYVGINDYDVKLFEGQFPLSDGMAYNSYLILDEKVAVLDTVEKKFKDKWLSNIENNLKGKPIDYLIIHHMEPDHSSNIISLLEKYKDIVVVASSKAFTMMKNYFDNDFINQRIVVKDFDSLSLGKHELTFFMAPMLHWPEVMMSYDKKSKVLFSADAFGKFGVNNTKSEWKNEARRYYFSIVGRYGKQVNSILNKIIDKEIEVIYSLHGSSLKGDIDYYLNTYKLWANYDYEEEGVVIAYTSVYGNTKEAIDYMKQRFKEKGYKKVLVLDLIEFDLFYAVAMAFKYSTLILATITYNNDIFPKMKHFIEYLIERNYQKRKVALIENGSFALNAVKIMKDMLRDCENITYIEPTISIYSTLKNDDKKQIDLLIGNIIKGEN